MPSTVRAIEAKPYDEVFKDLTSALSLLDALNFPVAAVHVATAIESLEKEIAANLSNSTSD